MKGKSLARAARHYLGLQLAAVEAEEAGIRADEDPECLHRFRVALRRSRSLLGELKDLLVPELARLRHRLAAAGKATNACRDADVLLPLLLEWRNGLPDSLHPGLSRLESILRQQRQTAHSEVVDLLQSRDYQALKRNWHHWLVLSPEEWFEADGQLPATKVLRPRIQRRFKKLRRRLAAMTADAPAEDVHRLRIGAKKLRYLLEFQAAESGDKKTIAVIAKLRRLQKILGHHHDAAIQFTWLQGVLGSVASDPVTAAAIGWLLADRYQSQQRMIAKLAKRLSLQ